MTSSGSFAATRLLAALTALAPSLATMQLRLPAPAPAPPPPQLSSPTPQPPGAVALKSGWRFRPDPANVGLHELWAQGGAGGAGWQPVTLPEVFNPLITKASDGGRVGWYELRFTGPVTAAGRAWEISFESVRRHATVWLNGRLLGSHDDPYSPFSLPATTLYPRAPNVLLVRVDNIKASGSLPEDWWNWGGIAGPVTLEPTAQLSLHDLTVLPKLGCAFRCGQLLIQGTLANTGPGTLRPAIDVDLQAPDGLTIRMHSPQPPLPGHGTTHFSFRVPVRSPVALWSPNSPSLYSVRIALEAQGVVQQQRGLRVGMRSVKVHGGILTLNGKRVWLHGAAIHEDMPGRGAALSDGDIDTIVAQLRSLGANVTRAHYLLSERLLDALDQAGIMVWEQPPVDHADATLATAAGRARALSTLSATLAAARNHPSVVVDSIGNELTPVPDATPGSSTYLREAAAVARRLSPDVPVALDIYCYPGLPPQRAYANLDLLGISDYYGWYKGLPGHSIASFAALKPYLELMHARYPRQALTVSEYGAEALFDGPVSVKGSYGFQSAYLQRTLALLATLPFMNGSIYWTLREFAVAPGWVGGAQLPAGAAPDGIHHKGLIAYDGTEKPAFSLAARLLSGMPPFVR